MTDSQYDHARMDLEPATPDAPRYTHGDFYRDAILREPVSLKFRLWQKRRLKSV